MKKVIVSIATASLFATSAWASSELTSGLPQQPAASAAADTPSAQFSQADISAVLSGENSQTNLAMLTPEQMQATDGGNPALRGLFLAGVFIAGKAFQACKALSFCR